MPSASDDAVAPEGELNAQLQPGAMEQPHDRLRQARMAAGFHKAADAARALSVREPTYSAHENGSRKFKYEDAEKYGRKFGVRAAWLMTAEEPRERVAQRRSQSRAIGGGRQPSNMVEVIEPDVRAGLGSGGQALMELVRMTESGVVISEDAERDRWGVPANYMHGQLRVRGQPVVVEVYGDSMYDPANPNAMGSLLPGDRVIVDLGDCNPTPPGHFLMWDGTGIVVKMVEVVRGSKEPPRLRLKSRNPHYEPYEVTAEEAKILGRVRGRITAM
jgi:phage repressor protein C with HTH and peptisase S24 domain